MIPNAFLLQSRWSHVGGRAMNLLICFNMSFRGIDFILPRLAFSRTNVTKTQVTFQVVSRARPCDKLERSQSNGSSWGRSVDWLMRVLSKFFESVVWLILRMSQSTDSSWARNEPQFFLGGGLHRVLDKLGAPTYWLIDLSGVVRRLPADHLSQGLVPG